MAINPSVITTIRVDQLPDDTLTLDSLFPHTVGTDLKSSTIQELVDLVATTLGVSTGVGFLPISVTNGQQLPNVPTDPSFFLCGAGTYLNVNGYPDVICTEAFNAVMSLSDHWELAVEIPITYVAPAYDLQAVTDVGNVTTNEIKAKWFEFYDAANDAYGKVFFEDGIYTFYDSVGSIMFSFDNVGNDIRYNADGFNLYKNNGLLTADRIRQEPDKDGMYAMLDDIAENHVKIINQNGLTDGKNFHTFFQIDGALFAGERADGVHQPRFLKYPDKNDLTTFEYIQMTNSGAGVNGFESICYNDSDSCFYGMLSNTSKIIKIPSADISTYTITTMTDLPSGCTFAGSGGIVTDGTYLYIGTEQDPHSFILKVRISDMTTVNSYEWSRPVIHSANISIAKGYAVFATNGNPCYALKVKLSDFTHTEYLVGGSSKTDDFALIDDDSIGYFLGVFGAENVLDGNKSMVLDLDTGDTYPINFMPSTGIYYDPNTYTIFSCSSVGFVETIDVNGINDGVINGTVPQESVINSFTMRGFWVNELALYWNGTSNEVYVTTWNNTTSGSIKKVELIYFPNALITREQLYYLGLMNGGSGVTNLGYTASPTNGIITNDTGTDATIPLADSTNAGLLKPSKYTLLESITEAFTTGLKSAYDGAVSWISTNGSAILAHLSNTSNPHSTTASQVGAVAVNSAITGATKTKITYDSKGLVTSGADATTADISDSTNKRYVTEAQLTVIGNTSGTNTGDETSSTIKTKLGITTLSGSNTGDQDLSSLAPKASPAFTGTPTAPTQSANDNSTKLATTAYVDTGLGLKASKSDIMILSSAYVLSNSTSLQKAFNVGSGGNGAFNATANKTYRFRCELDMTGLSGSTSAISFGFLGTATISSLSYKSNAIKAVLSNVSGGTITSIQVATISAITATSTATAAKAMITGIIRVSGAGTIIPAVATGVGNATSQVEANSFFEITELGSDTLTATSNII